MGELKKAAAWEIAYVKLIFGTLLAIIHGKIFRPPPLEKILGAHLSVRVVDIQYSTKVFGALEPLSRFLELSPKQMQISTPNFQHPLSRIITTYSVKI